MPRKLIYDIAKLAQLHARYGSLSQAAKAERIPIGTLCSAASHLRAKGFDTSFLAEPRRHAHPEVKA